MSWPWQSNTCALYAIERQAPNRTAPERLALRQKQLVPRLAELRQHLFVWKEQLLPWHPMAVRWVNGRS